MTNPQPGAGAKASLASLFAALCAAGAYISIPIPISPIPLALTNLFAVLGGLLLGPGWGALSAFAYVGLGSLGFPIFSNGRGGLAYLAGPTGGYLVGYIAGAAAAGLLSRRGGRTAVCLASAVGFLAILALGVCGLALVDGVPWSKAAAVGILPFLPGDALKAAVAALVAIKLGPFVSSISGGSGARRS